MAIDEMIAVLEADKKGKKIYRRSAACRVGLWQPKDAGEAYAFDIWEYQVAPEPRERWLPDDCVLEVFGELTEDNCLMRWPDCKPVLFREVME